MLLTPLGAGLAAAGPLARGTGAVGTAAKAALAATGVGFGVQCGTDLAKHSVTAQAQEKPEDYVRRVGGDAAMLMGGAAGALDVPHLASRPSGSEHPNGVVEPGKVATNAEVGPMAAPSADNVQSAPQSDPTTAPTASGAIRKAQALGGAKVTTPSRTVYVDPCLI